MRKRSDDDLDKYNQIVVVDEQEMEHEYKNEYRGKVQNRHVVMAQRPMYELSYVHHPSEVRSYVPFDRQVEQWNRRWKKASPLYIKAGQEALDEASSKRFFQLIDTLSVAAGHAMECDLGSLLFMRAIAYGEIQNFEEAKADLDACLSSDSTWVLAYWQRAVCSAKQAEYMQSQGKDGQLLRLSAINDLSVAIHLNGQNAYLFYNRGYVHATLKDERRAIEDFSRAIVLDPHLPEAYYNRGLVRIQYGQVNEGVADLSKAGELGLFDAYSVIKKYRK